MFNTDGEDGILVMLINVKDGMALVDTVRLF